MASEPVATVERHASWKELFFDLVVVAGIGQLAHLLHEDTEATTLGFYAVLYLAFWISWASFAVYGNIAGDDAKTPVLLTAMLGLAVMAASVPGIEGSRATAFVVAYVALRWFAGAVFQRGRVILDWPLAQAAVGAVPWLVSLWVDAPLRYWLWGLGIVIDLTVLLVASPARSMQNAEERLERAKRNHRGRPRTDQPLEIVGTRADEEHLWERLGLFVIIVLGEGLIQIIDAAADSARWDLATAVVALGAFALLAAVWAVGLLHGTAGIPQLRPHTVSPRIVLLLHALLTGTLAALAASLGVALEHLHEELPVEYRTLLCGSVAAYCALGVVTSLVVGGGRRWILVRGLPGVVVPLLLLVVWPDLGVGALVWLLVAVVMWVVVARLGRQDPGSGRGDRPSLRRGRTARRPSPADAHPARPTRRGYARQGGDAAARLHDEGSVMSINDDDITSEPAPAGEGVADGGANPGGHDGGADGSAGEGPADGGANPGGHDGGADGSAGEGPADGGANPDGHDGGADGSA
jgi:low temperature requirement protein LtrA